MDIKKKTSEYDELLKAEADVVFSASTDNQTDSEKTLHAITKALNKYKWNLFDVNEDKLPKIDESEIDRLMILTKDERKKNTLEPLQSRPKLHLMLYKLILPLAAMLVITISFFFFKPEENTLCLVNAVNKSKHSLALQLPSKA